MCGIAGIFRPAGLMPLDARAVDQMVAAQHHRGPSGTGRRVLGRAVIGHARLAIIDLSDAGTQPMTNEDGSVWITYNGELYNTVELRQELVSHGHVFRSHSDTEVLVHGYEQWGTDALLERVRGMFAFGIYDERCGLTLVRDRLGIKPLYVSASRDGAVVFASEVKALLASGLVSSEPDITALTGFLLAGSVAAPRTYVKAVSSLLPGEYFQVLISGQSQRRRYWELPFSALVREARSSQNETSGVSHATVRHLLNDSVARHLVSEVPIGVFLSGGIDSGAVVACAHRVRKGQTPLTTLTVTFDEHEFNEAEPTRAIARRFGTDHREVHVTKDAFMRALPAVFAAMDQPTNDGVNTYFVSKAAKEAGLTVVLSGLGGDEVFWGYSHYRWVQKQGNVIAAMPSLLRNGLAMAGAAVGRVVGKDNWMRLAFLRGGGSSREQYLALRGFFPPSHVMDLLGIGSAELKEAVDDQFAAASALPVSESGPDGFNYIEFNRYLHDQLLRDTDVFSMAHSVEVRVPLLDHTLVECVGHAAPNIKCAAARNKPLLVDAVDEPLLLHASRAKKRGFSFPMDIWMREAGGDIEEIATSGKILNPVAVRARWTEFNQRRLHWSRAWALSVLSATVG